MTKDLADIMKEEMQKDGFWVMKDPSETALAVLALLGGNTAEERAEYASPQKYIERDNKVAVINLTMNEWGGVEVYRKRDIHIRYDQGRRRLIVKRNIGSAKRLLKIGDFLVPDGEETTVTPSGTTVTGPKYRIDDRWFEALSRTGYITEEEARHFWSSAVTAELPHIVEEE